VGTVFAGVVVAGVVVAGFVVAGVVVAGFVAAGVVVAGGVGVGVGSPQLLKTKLTASSTINGIRNSFFTLHLLVNIRYLVVLIKLILAYYHLLN
jgi:hypothetical protein